jgi:phage terminase small subunit
MPAIDNAKHEAFAQGLAKGLSASEAYIAAGYKDSRSAASRLSTNVNVQARVAELVGRGAQKAEVEVGRVLQELARLSFSDPRRAFDANGQLIAITDWTDDLAAAVSSIEVVTRSLPGEADEELDAQPHGGALARKRNAKVEYIHKIKFWDKNSALEKIAKHLGMFVDRQELTGKDGGAIEFADMTDIERARRVAFALAKASNAQNT